MDLTERQHMGTPVHAFRTLAKLQGHIKKSMHYLPRDKAKRQGNGLLALLLRRIVE